MRAEHDRLRRIVADEGADDVPERFDLPLEADFQPDGRGGDPAAHVGEEALRVEVADRQHRDRERGEPEAAALDGPERPVRSVGIARTARLVGRIAEEDDPGGAVALRPASQDAAELLAVADQRDRAAHSDAAGRQGGIICIEPVPRVDDVRERDAVPAAGVERRARIAARSVRIAGDRDLGEIEGEATRLRQSEREDQRRIDLRLERLDPRLEARLGEPVAHPRRYVPVGRRARIVRALVEEAGRVQRSLRARYVEHPAFVGERDRCRGEDEDAERERGRTGGCHETAPCVSKRASRRSARASNPCAATLGCVR